MSYDIEICAKVEGADMYVRVYEPTYCNPTYNLRDMFVACMDWNYQQGRLYPLLEAIPKIIHGYREITEHPERYYRYNSPNGWGTVENARECLKNWKDEIVDGLRDNVDVPAEYLYWRW